MTNFKLRFAFVIISIFSLFVFSFCNKQKVKKLPTTEILKDEIWESYLHSEYEELANIFRNNNGRLKAENHRIVFGDTTLNKKD